MDVLEKRVALVTEGSRGLGLAIARQLAQLGYRVVLTAADAHRADEAAKGLEGWASGDVAGVPMDVKDDASVRSAFEQAVGLYGSVDVLVYNAEPDVEGPRHRAAAPDLSTVRTTMEASLFGAWRCASEAVPLMSARGYGRIVNVSSPLGGTEGTAAPGSPAGQVSTAALVMLTQVLAAEVEFDGILVNAASPGCTRPPASPDAERPSDLAADTAVWLATLPDDGPTGRCFDADRQALAAGDRP